jgi:cysteine desulfurase
MRKRIYMDYAAATPTDERVLQVMEPFWNKQFANPNAIHDEGKLVKKSVDSARLSVVKSIGAKNEEEIVFTSGGTESNALAILGVIGVLRDAGGLSGAHIVTSVIEHPSVLDCFKSLEKEGVKVSFVPVHEDGLIDVESFKAFVDDSVVFVSMMLANNEIGTIQPIKEIASILKKRAPKALLHSDASQSPTYHSVDVSDLGVDLLTLDGIKIYGPKGTGILFIKDGIQIKPLFIGGKQENKIRPGTQNVPGIIGFAKALEIANDERENVTAHMKELQTYFFRALLRAIPETIINGSREHRLANNVNVSFEGIDSGFLEVQLSEAGIAVASKSACMEEGAEGSYVVSALGNGHSGGGIRFSLGKENTKEEIDFVVETVRSFVSRK